MTPEFSRTVRIDSVGEASWKIRVEADAGERAALAKRFGLLALDRLAADAELCRQGDTVFATGRISAAVVQACVASAEPVPAKVDEPFTLRFMRR